MEIKISLEAIARLVGKSEQELRGLFEHPEGSEDAPSQKDVDKAVSDLFGSRLRDVGEDQRRRGTREALTSLEKEIRSKFGIQSEKRGIELVEEIVEDVKLAVEKQPTELNEEELKKLPMFKNVMMQVVKDKESEIERLKKEQNDFKLEVETRELRQEVQKHGRLFLEQQKAVLGDTPEAVEKTLNFFFSGLDYRKFKAVEEAGVRRIVPIGEDGEVLTKNYSPVSFEEWLKEAYPLGFHKFDPGKNGAPKVPEKGGKDTKDVPVFKTREELNKWMSANTTTSYEVQKAAIEAFEASEKGK